MAVSKFDGLWGQSALNKVLLYIVKDLQDLF